MGNAFNIICLYWVGDFRGRKFKLSHIHRLQKSVAKHIDRRWKFWVLTNDDYLIRYGMPQFKWNIIPLKYAWPGWWSKTELHRPDLKEIIRGRTLYMDLDSHAVSSLQPILDFEGDLAMFPTGSPLSGTKIMSRGLVYKYQAATMLFDPGCEPMTKVWNKFIENPKKWMKLYRSEQDIMSDWIPDQPMMPREWYCKLDSVKKLGCVPEGVKIVTGQPKDGSFHKVDKLKWFEEIAR